MIENYELNKILLLRYNVLFVYLYQFRELTNLPLIYFFSMTNPDSGVAQARERLKARY